MSEVTAENVDLARAFSWANLARAAACVAAGNCPGCEQALADGECITEGCHCQGTRYSQRDGFVWAEFECDIDLSARP